eukprot:1464611-Pyramimonas_sp.AAC.1
MQSNRHMRTHAAVHITQHLDALNAQLVLHIEEIRRAPAAEGTNTRMPHHSAAVRQDRLADHMIIRGA